MKNIEILNEKVNQEKSIRDLKVIQLDNDFGEERFALSALEYYHSTEHRKVPLFEWHFVIKDGKVGYMDISKNPYAGNPAKYSFKETYHSIDTAFESFIADVNRATKDGR